ncbi:MAG TPA: hypothetical protein VI937_00935 [Negativicutes bacterium]|nr:hypothetical protein [Negativicutes bacterium]
MKNQINKFPKAKDMHPTRPPRLEGKPNNARIKNVRKKAKSR